MASAPLMPTTGLPTTGPVSPARRSLRKRRVGLALAAVCVAAARLHAFRAVLHTPDTVEVSLGILLVASVLWMTEAVPLFVTSLIVLVLELAWLAPALARGGVAASATTFLSPFFSDVTLLFLGGFVVSAALQKVGLDGRLARRIVRATGGSTSRLQLLLLVTTAGLSMWMSNTAATGMMLALVGALTGHLGERDGLRKSLLVGIPFAANLGGLATPIGTPPNAIAIHAMQRAGVAPSFPMWMLLATPFLVLLLGATALVLRRMYPTQTERVELPSTDAAPPPARAERFVLGVVGATVLGWMTTDLHGLSSGLVGIFPVILFFGAGLLRQEDVRTLPWDVILLIGGGLSLGDAVERGGLASWLVGHLPAEGLSTGALVAIVAVVASAMTAVMSNTATANLLLPVVGAMRPGEPALLLAVAFSCSLSMPLPVSTPPNAMVFASGHLEVRDILRPGLVVTAAGLALTVLVGPALWAWALR